MAKRKSKGPPAVTPQGALGDGAPSSSTPADSFVYSDPVSEAFGGLFALTQAGTVLDPGEMVPRMQAAIGSLSAVADCREQIRRSLQSSLSKCLVGLQLTRGRCKDCIDDAMRTALKVATDCCDRNKQCIERNMVNALTDAWVIAERYGCQMPGSPSPSPSPAPSPQPQPPGDGLEIVEYSPSPVTVYSPILDSFGNPFVSALSVDSAAIAGAMQPAPAGFPAPLAAAAPLAAGGQGFPAVNPVARNCPPGFAPARALERTFDAAVVALRAQGYEIIEQRRLTIDVGSGPIRVVDYCSRYNPQGSSQPIAPPIAPYPPPPGRPSPPIPPPSPPSAVCPVDPPCPEPQPRDWRAWYSPGMDECYVTGPGVAPRSEDDDLLWQGKSKSQAERVAKDYCERDEFPKPGRPPKRSPLHGVDWCDPYICDTLDHAAPPSQPFSGFSLPQLMGLLKEDGSLNDEVFGKGSGPIGRAVSKLLSGIISIGPMLAQMLIDGVMSPFACGTSADSNLALVRSVLGLAETFLGDVASDASQPWEYWARYRCPQEIPTADGARAAYLADAIDEKTLECWVRANNQCFEPWLKTLEAARSKPTPLELSFMRRRGWITDQELDQGYRQLGYLNGSDRRRLHALTEQIPPMSEILRYMVRDADDAALVQQFGMDDLFDQKFGGQLRQWAEGLGITEQFARYSWRAHWSIPSPGQLYTFYHRLRNDPQYWKGRNPVDVIKEALVQQDILPFWQDAFIATSFRPLTRVDARRAFEIGSLDEAALAKSYTDQGYDDQNAQVLVDFNKRLKAEKAKRSKWIKYYKQGGMNRAAVEARLVADGYDAATLPPILDAALAEARSESRAKCVQAIRRRMLTGEFDQQGATDELIAQGVDADQAAAIASGWGCERAAKGKVATAAQLANWFELGLIDLGDMIDRLERLGYSRQDAGMLALGILNRIDQKQTKATEAAQRKAEQKQAAAERAAERLARRSEKALRDMEKVRQARARALERRERAVIAAGVDLAKKSGSRLDDAVVELRRLVALLRSKYNQSADDAVEAAVVAVEAFPAGQPISGLEAVAVASIAAQDGVQSDGLED